MADTTWTALIDDDDEIQGLLLLSDGGCYRRDEGDWVPLDNEGDNLPFILEDLEAVDTTDMFVSTWDASQTDDKTLARSDLPA